MKLEVLIPLFTWMKGLTPVPILNSCAVSESVSRFVELNVEYYVYQRLPRLALIQYMIPLRRLPPKG
jgi:hypothetical protein